MFDDFVDGVMIEGYVGDVVVLFVCCGDELFVVGV